MPYDRYGEWYDDEELAAMQGKEFLPPPDFQAIFNRGGLSGREEAEMLRDRYRGNSPVEQRPFSERVTYIEPPPTRKIPYVPRVVSDEEAANTPTLIGYGTKTAILRPGQEPIGPGGAPASSAYVKDIQDTIAAVDSGKLSETDLKRNVAKQEGVSSWGGVSAKEGGEKDIAEASRNFMEINDQAIEDEVKRRTRGSLSDFISGGMGLGKAADASNKLEKFTRDAVRKEYEQMFYKTYAVEQEEKRHVRNVEDQKARAWHIQDTPDGLVKVNTVTNEVVPLGIKKPDTREGKLSDIEKQELIGIRSDLRTVNRELAEVRRNADYGMEAAKNRLPLIEAEYNDLKTREKDLLTKDSGTTNIPEKVPTVKPSVNADALIKEANEAIARGADPAKVKQRLKEQYGVEVK